MRIATPALCSVLLCLLICVSASPLKGQGGLADSSLVLHLPFDGNANDVSGFSNHGTIYGATLTADRFGHPSSAYAFNGTTDRIEIPNSPSINPTNQLTVTFWFRVDGMIANYLAFFHKGGPISGYYANREYALYLKSNYEAPYFELMSAGDGQGQRVAFSDGHTIQTWRFFAGVIDRQSHVTTIYVDSVKDSETYDAYSSFNVNNYPLTLGWEQERRPDVAGLSGALDDFRIYTRALSAQEIHDLYVADTAGAIRIPSEIRFGIVPVGSNASQTLRIENTGSAALTVSGVTSSNPVFAVPTAGFQIPGHAAKTLVVTYTPATAAPDTGTITVSSNDPGSPTIGVHVSGRGHLPVAAPVIATIADIPNDNGRQVRLTWYRSSYDSLSQPTHVSAYSIYRRVAGEADLWDYVGTVPATGFERYSYVAPTLHDARPLSGTAWSVFKIAAQLSDQVHWYFSDPDSGYSVDSYPPAQPVGLAGTQTLPGSVTLTWNSPGGSDVDQYLVFRSRTSDFVPSTTTLLGVTRSNDFTDPTLQSGVSYFYRVVAEDESGNWSAPSGIFALTVTEVAAGAELPRSMGLDQNFPNPFNPSTTIRFALSSASRVRLTVFTTLGQQVAEPVNGELEAGYHTVQFNGAGLASGVYFYRLQAGSYVEMKKMILTK